MKILYTYQEQICHFSALNQDIIDINPTEGCMSFAIPGLTYGDFSRTGKFISVLKLVIPNKQCYLLDTKSMINSY